MRLPNGSRKAAVEGASDEARRGMSSAARLLWSIRAFARGAGDFQRMVDDYGTLPFDVPEQVDALTTAARRLNEDVHAAPGLESTHDDWEAILDVLERMTRLLAGRDVEVPAAHVVAPLSGARLEEFRRLAGDLELSALKAYEKARQDVGDYRDRGQQFLEELRYLAARSRDLQGRADAVQVNPQQIGPIVDRLMEEARQADRRMRDARVFRSVWDDSGWMITILQRMAGLVRS